MKSYETLGKDLAKEKFGSKWGLKYYNAKRRAEALYKRVGGAFVESNSKPQNIVDYMTFGILSGKAKYNVTYKELEKDVDKAITIARLTPMAEKYDKDVVVKTSNGEEKTLESIKSLLEKYKNDEITKEELFQKIEEYKSSNEYQFRAYEK